MIGTISENIQKVKFNIEEAARKSGRNPEDITLIGISKTVEADRVQMAVDSGICHLGENKVQELCEKYDKVKGAKWHLVGHLQTNKVKQVLGKVSLIHSVDSMHLAQEIEKRAEAMGIFVDFLLQINVSGEESKFGINPSEAEAFSEFACSLKYARLKGLMTVPPPAVNPSDNKKYFDRLFEISVDIEQKKYHNINMDILSMGMSGDYTQAIECGATMVRVGSAIFGQRIYNI